MAEAEDLTDLPWWGGVYALNRSARAESYGEVVDLVSRKIRESARSAGHEPRGAVDVAWSEWDPDEWDPDDPAILLREPEPHPTKVWAKVAVRVDARG